VISWKILDLAESEEVNFRVLLQIQQQVGFATAMMNKILT
jgi:hypothetical protein